MTRNRLIEFGTDLGVPLLLCVLVPLLALRVDTWIGVVPADAHPWPLLLAGWALALGGAGLALWAVVAFKTHGRGTPNPQLPPQIVVTSGPYRVSRNPMVVGATALLLGQAVLYQSPTLLVIALLFAVVLALNAELVEEPALDARFGAAYVAYRCATPRFLPNPLAWLGAWLRPAVDRHPLLAFFGLTYAISWSFWGLEAVLKPFNPVAAPWLATLAPFGPTLAAIAITGLLVPEHAPSTRSRRLLLGSALVFAGTAWITISLAPQLLSGPSPLLAVALWLAVTLLPAWLVWSTGSECMGVRDLLRTLVAWRARPVWYVAAIGLPLALGICGLLVTGLLGQPVPPLPRSEPPAVLLPLLVSTFLGTLLYGGPLGEEAGWRGFALPRLQAQHSPLTASLVLSVVWGLWHLPLHLAGFYQGIYPDGLPGILLRIVSSVPLAILFTWLFNRSGGNLWLAVLLHTAVNNVTGFWLPVTSGLYVVGLLLAALLVITDRMWHRQPPASSANQPPLRARVLPGER